MGSKYIELKLSEYANLHELNYRENIQPHESQFVSIENWHERINDGRLKVIPFLVKNVTVRGDILELGAGSCWCSAELSKIPEVSRVFSLDFSEKLLCSVAPNIMDYLHADKNKITRVHGDFYDLSYFNEKMFDLIVYFSSLHHANLPVKSLSEAKRILKDDGHIVCISEPILGDWVPLKSLIKSRHGEHEKRYGVVENIFTLDEWKHLFDSAGFNVTFTPYFPLTSVKSFIQKYTPLRLLNGYIYASYIMTAEKKQS